MYCARRYFWVVAGILDGLPAEVLKQLKPSVPLFAKPLRPGIAVADDPGGGQSFGMNRCGILAEAMVQAWHRGESRPEAQLAIVEARFADYGLTLDRPYLASGAIDVFDLAQPEAVAA